MTDELKPCPFCGSNDIAVDWYMPLFQNEELDFVKCFDCGCMGKHVFGEKNAIEAWNRRAE